MKPKHQRLLLASFAIAGLTGASLIAASALRDEASYFYTPATLHGQNVPAGQAIRLGGLVKLGSIKSADDGVTINFTVQDKDKEQLVHFTGVTPNLFVEGSGVVADGRLNDDGIFIADNLLAKHDENYVPRELQDVDVSQAKSYEKSVIQ